MRVVTTFTLLLVASLAGCAGSAPPEGTQDTPGGPEPTVGPQAVVALIDTGINPYHVDFRDNSSLAHVHPSEYLPGFPADAPALNITLNATSLDDALAADAGVWDSVERGSLYWIPGTKIVGAITFNGGNIYDTGHGTMTASRAAGNGYSLCPECRIAAVQGFSGEAVTWASQQAWIDAQSNSWSPLIVFQQADNVPVLQEAGLADAFEAAADRHMVFGSAGNGIMGKGGVIGHPSFTRSTSGPPGVVSVGGHDNGEVVIWSGSWPHVVADACRNWAAVGHTLDEYADDEGGGTSSASPYAAGAAARFVLEARMLLNDTYDAGVQDGILARGDPLDAPLLDDGELTVDEAKTLLMKSAAPRPTYTEHDGASCRTYPLYNTYPIAWEDIPQQLPTYYFIGYGQVSVHSLATGLEVLRGEPMPERPTADQWHAYAETLRETYSDLPH